MKNLFIGIFLGSLVCFSILKFEQKNKYEFGKAQGFIAGLQKAADIIDKNFPIVKAETDMTILFSVKTTDVVSYLEDGQKKIGVLK